MPRKSFGQLNRLSHPGAEQPDTNLAVAKNCDMFQEGSVSPRDGLVRPSLWPGIFHTADGVLNTNAASHGTYGNAVVSLIPADPDIKTAPALDFDEDS